MTKVHDFLEKYFAKFLSESRIRNPIVEEKLDISIPPLCEEVESLILFLQNFDLDPIIIGTLASIKHLKITEADIQMRLFRPAPSLELFVKKPPSLMPPGWKETDRAEGICWISPSRGYVDFKMPEDLLPVFKNSEPIEKDQESVEQGCPVASLRSIFRLKLNSEFTNDLSEILSLMRRVGLPSNLEKDLRTEIQWKNFEMIKHWAKLRLNG